jgi:hypothetical protein
MHITNAGLMLDSAKWAEMRAQARYIRIIRLVGFVAILCTPFSLWALFWTSPRDFPFLSSMLCVPVITYAYVLLFNRLWRGDRFVKLLFGAGIAARFAAAGFYVYTGFFWFHSSVDAFHYWSVGLDLVEQYSMVGWAAFHPPYWSSNLIYDICGIIMLVTGNAMPALFVIFALAALLGGYFFYRGFCLAFPLGNNGLYGLLVVLLPSILFWSSAIGKDALAQLFIGISAYGFARVTKKVDARAILVCIIGVAGCAAVRPHIGAMLAVSILVPFGLGKAAGGWMTIATKILLLPLLAAGTWFLLSRAEDFVGMQSTDLQSGIRRIDSSQQNATLGSSSVNQRESLTARIVQGPFLIFRPFPWEVHSPAAGITSLEALGLLFLCWCKRREFWGLLRRWREAYVGFLLLYSLEFCVVFAAATGNFGTLVRQRSMVVPIVLMLFCANRLASADPVPRPTMQRNPWRRHASPHPSRTR